MNEAKPSPMPTVCMYDRDGDGIAVTYVPVFPDATEWVWADVPCHPGAKVVVTEHGLRRLLRFVADVQGMLMWLSMKDKPEVAETWAEDVEQKRVIKALNESTSIWCEGDLIMSRLFVTKDGKAAIAHPDEDTDKTGIPPWEAP